MGRQGYCKLCSFDDPDVQFDFDKAVRAGWTPKKLNVWLESKDLKPVDRLTVYKHREHVASPKDRMVSAVAKHQAEQGVVPAKVSEEEYLEAIVSAAAMRLQADPGAVTIDQGIKAAQVRGTLKNKGQNIALSLIFTGQYQISGQSDPQIIEGEAREID